MANYFIGTTILWKSLVFFMDQENKIACMPVENADVITGMIQMEYASTIKWHYQIVPIGSFLLCAVSQVRCRWDGWIWIMEGEPARDDIIPLKVKTSTVTKAQEREKHKPDQHLTHSTSDMSSSDTFVLINTLFTSAHCFSILCWWQRFACYM